VGHSDFASYNNDGSQVKSPVFPFSLRYEPKGNVSFPSELTEDFTDFDLLE